MKKYIFLLVTGYWLLVTGYVFGQEEGIEYTAEDLPDPFSPEIPEEIPEAPKEEIPISEVPISLPRFDIEGLVWGSAVPQAIINGKILKIGDKIEGAEIINITKEGVDIIYEGKLFSLPSPGSQILEKEEEK